MSVLTKPRLMTAEEFAALQTDERVELIRGELRPMPPPPGGEYGELENILSTYASFHALERGLGKCYGAETGFIVARSPDIVMAPDWAFIRYERAPAQRPKGHIPVVPDAVLEVRSPSTSAREAREKAETWVEVGVQLVWELHPANQTLTIYRPGQEARTVGVDGDIKGEDVLPGFSLPMRRLFAPR